MQPLFNSVRFRLSAGAFALAFAACSCSSGSVVLNPNPGSTHTSAPTSTPTLAPTATPTPAPTPEGASATGTLTTSTTSSSSITLGPYDGGYTTTIALPATSTAIMLQLTASTTLPANAPDATRHRFAGVTFAGDYILGSISLTSPFATFTLPADAINITIDGPAGITVPNADRAYLAYYDPNHASSGYMLGTGAATVTPATPGRGIGFNWTLPINAITIVEGSTYNIVGFTESPTATPPPSPSPTASGSPGPTPSPSSTPNFQMISSTSTGNGIVDLPQSQGGTAAYAVAANNASTTSFPGGELVVNSGSLPLAAQICETTASGQCMSPPTSNTLTDSFSAGQSQTFSVFLTSSGAAINNGTVTVEYQDAAGDILGQTSVTVQTTPS